MKHANPQISRKQRRSLLWAAHELERGAAVKRAYATSLRAIVRAHRSRKAYSPLSVPQVYALARTADVLQPETRHPGGHLYRGVITDLMAVQRSHRAMRQLRRNPWDVQFRRRGKWRKGMRRRTKRAALKQLRIWRQTGWKVRLQRRRRKTRR